MVCPDGWLWVTTPATTIKPPPGGWPTSPNGEAEDADATGTNGHPWSISLANPTDVRDERLIVGAFAFTNDALVWTDGSNSNPGQVRVRDDATGNVRTFDPQTGERCNLLGFSAWGDRIVFLRYCSTYAGGVRDDRAQVLSTLRQASGDPAGQWHPWRPQR